MSKVNTKMLEQLRGDIDRALESIGGAYGYTITAGNCRYTDHTFTFQLKGSALDVDGSGTSADEAEYRRMAPLFGVDPDSYGKEFRSGAKVFRPIRIKLKNRKYPFLCEDVNRPGDVYKMEPERLKQHFPA